MNITDELQNDLNKYTIHQVSDLHRIAEKHGVDDMDLLVYDCATSTAALIGMGYGGKLTALLYQCKNNKEYYNE